MRFAFALCGTFVLLPLANAFTSADEPPPAAAELREAAMRALPLLTRTADGYMAERKCFACHHQTLPLLAWKTAQSRGVSIDADWQRRLLQFVENSLESGRARYLEGRGQGGNAITAGYALWTLSLGDAKATATTDMVVDYLATAHQDSVHWRVTTLRPPSEGSQFAATYVAIRGLQAYGTTSQRETIARRCDDVRQKLLDTPAKDTEDRVFRLGCLARLNSDEADRRGAAEELLRTQRADGGWSQLDDGDSDPYATGTALYMLFETGSLGRRDPAAPRALRYLLQTQQADGSWHVRSRSKPIQTYFETGFPYEKDQFISAAATGWATVALFLACPERVQP